MGNNGGDGNTGSSTDMASQIVFVSYKKRILVFDDVNKINLSEVQVLTGKELPIVLFNNVKKKELNDLHLPFELSKGIKEQ